MDTAAHSSGSGELAASGIAVVVAVVAWGIPHGCPVDLSAYAADIEDHTAALDAVAVLRSHWVACQPAALHAGDLRGSRHRKTVIGAADPASDLDCSHRTGRTAHIAAHNLQHTAAARSRRTAPDTDSCTHSALRELAAELDRSTLVLVVRSWNWRRTPCFFVICYWTEASSFLHCVTSCMAKRAKGSCACPVLHNETLNHDRGRVLAQ